MWRLTATLIPLFMKLDLFIKILLTTQRRLFTTDDAAAAASEGIAPEDDAAATGTTARLTGLEAIEGWILLGPRRRRFASWERA